MIFDIEFLKKTMDAVRNDPALKTITNKSGEVVRTHCNINCFRVSQDLGCNHWWNFEYKRPMLANEMIDFANTHPEQFSKFHEPVVAWNICNLGYLVFAACKDTPHGHIVPIYPSSVMETSGNFKCQVPYCSEIVSGKVQGINYSFKEMPDFYLAIY